MGIKHHIFVLLVAAILAEACSGQRQSFITRSNVRERGKRVRRHTQANASADQMVQNILQWLQGMYTQNTRKIRQGSLRQYLPPINTQKPRPFEPVTPTPQPTLPGGGYPPAGSTPTPPFPPIHTSPAGGGGLYPGPGNDITPPFTRPDYPGGGYPHEPSPQPPFTEPEPAGPSTLPSSQRPGFPTAPPPGASTGYPSFPSQPPTGFPTQPPTGYPGYPSTGFPSQPPTGYPTKPPTGFPTGPSTGFPSQPPTGFPTGPPTGFPTQPPTGYPTKPPTGFPTRPPTGFPTRPPTFPTQPPTGFPSQPPTGFPSQPPTGFPTQPPTGYPSQPSTGYPTQPPTGPTTGYPTQPPSPTSPPDYSPTPSPGGPGPTFTSPPDDNTIPPGTSPTTGPSAPPDDDLNHPPHIHAIDVQCAKDMMTINIEFNRQFDGIIYSKGYYNSPECRYVQQNSGQTKFTFTVSLNSCGTEFINAFDTQGQSYLENVLVLQNEPGIQEVWDTIRAVRCLWEGSLKESLSVALSVGMLSQEIVTFSGDTAMAKLDIQLGKGPFAPPANGLVKIGETMTLVVSVSGDPGFDIQVKDCRAKDSTEENVVALTDDDGCVLKPKLFGAFQKTRNTGSTGASIIAYAFFNAFKFPDVMDLMIECNIELCKTDCQMCPDPDQKIEPGRRRRDVAGLYYHNETIGDAVTMGKHLRVILPEDLSGGKVLLATENDGVCMSTQNFVYSSAIMISLLMSSCLFSAYMWLKNQRLAFKQ